MVCIKSILIVEPFDTFCDALEKDLAKKFRVYTCADGSTGLELLRRHRPEGLVLNLSLPGMDGLSFLEAAQEHRPDAILTLSAAYPPYVYRTLMDLGVGYSLLVPCRVHTVVYRISDMLRQDQAAVPLTAQEKASRLLQRLGAPYRQGYHMLRIGIPLYAQDRSQRMIKELYPAIAIACGCDNWQQVEAGIRECVQYMWKHRDPQLWEELFPNTTQCPSNKCFIACLADHLDDEAGP